jgi:hypothetical protein
MSPINNIQEADAGVPTSRFYKVLATTNGIIALIAVAVSILTYYFGISKGNVTCQLEDTTTIIQQQEKDNEIIQEEYNKLIDSYTDGALFDYLM